VIDRNLNPGITNSEVRPEDVPLDSCSYEDSVCVSNNRILLDDIAGVSGCGKTNTKITTLGITITY